MLRPVTLTLVSLDLMTTARAFLAQQVEYNGHAALVLEI